jgi:hypothetical protein
MKLYCTIYEGNDIYDTITFSSISETGVYDQYYDFVDYMRHFMPDKRIEITKIEKW